MTLFKLNLAQNDENVWQKYFWGLINTLTAEGFLETGPFMRFGNHALRVNNLKNTSAVRFNFSKCLKFNADSKNIGSQLVNDF